MAQGLPGTGGGLDADGGAELAQLAQLFQAGVPSIPECPAVWLAPDACLMQSHPHEAEGEPVVVQVVGVADHGDWAGAVLMLG